MEACRRRRPLSRYQVVFFALVVKVVVEGDGALVEAKPSGEDDGFKKITENPSPDPQPIAVAVPRLKRRGLFGQLSFVAEVGDARNYAARQTKWFLTVIVAITALPAPMGSTIFFRKRPCYVHVSFQQRQMLINCLQHP